MQFEIKNTAVRNKIGSFISVKFGLSNFLKEEEAVVLVTYEWPAGPGNS